MTSIYKERERRHDEVSVIVFEYDKPRRHLRVKRGRYPDCGGLEIREYAVGRTTHCCGAIAFNRHRPSTFLEKETLLPSRPGHLESRANNEAI
jgi:hypothetical protein